eukprot:GFUD01116541.1.p1 GENE.GFUD01116541.1~~GFUD01116541.1.p1  ORF type:complete len:494 (-),score=122.32 GFUD01116541.1:173-1591(-)
MGSFHRMKEDAEEMAVQVSSKLPGKAIIWIFLGVLVLIVFVLGFGIGFSSNGSNTCSDSSCQVPVYLFLSNNTESCPALTGENLLTRTANGQSFEGLSVHLQCQGNYLPFPTSVRCTRKKLFDGAQVLEWSNLPVCYPSNLISLEYWKETIHARSVVCSGDSKETECKLRCILNYVAVEEDLYRCGSMPCRAWSIKDKKCYICQSNCTQLQQHHNPAVSDLLQTLSCSPDCDKVVVTSSKGAAVWQSKRTGLFQFIGEHNGRPVYLKNSTSEYLYYSSAGAEWLVGPNFKTAQGGIQVFNNDDKSCPERHGGKNNTKLYIDPSKALAAGQTMWREDSSIQLQCYNPSFTPVTSCSCTKYQLLYSPFKDGKVPLSIKYHAGEFTRMEPENSFGLLAPVYQNVEKKLYLFSHHPAGLVWQVSGSLGTTPIRAVTEDKSCPDSEGLVWEWYNMTTKLGQQKYVRDEHMQVKCLDT